MQVRQRSPQWLVAVWGAIAFGALLASYSAFRPVRDALVLDNNPDQIPWLFTATFVAVGAISPLWSAVLARGQRRRHVTRAYHAFAACLIAFAVLVALEVAPIAVGRAFYIWSSVYSLFVISVFWSLLADLLGPTTARKLYGPIAAGGTVGALAGPALTRLLVDALGVGGILLMSAGLLELAVIAVHQVRRAGERLAPEAEAEAATAPERATWSTAFRGIAQLARSPYLLAICGYVLCTATAATFMYLEQASLVKQMLPDRTARTELFATIDLWTSAGTFVVQTVLAGPVVAWLGPGLVLAILPLAQGIGISVLAGAPSIGALIAIQAATRAATHGLTRPARELMFTVVSRDDKYRAKNAIDTIVYRFGDAGSAWLHNGLVALGGNAALVVATVPLVAIWIALATVMGVGFRRRAPLATKETS
ncbi:MAG: NTP/NDP exchange transporter [Kofleriaceae bacterium]